jgi:hypothetical protein
MQPIHPSPKKVEHSRFLHKVEREERFTRLTILDTKTKNITRLIVTKFATSETIHNAIKNYILTSIDIQEVELKCPDAPVKKRICFREKLIEGPTIPQNIPQNIPEVDSVITLSKTFIARIDNQCKMTLRNGNRCKCDVKKYGRCQYHLTLWKKAHPFQNHP